MDSDAIHIELATKIGRIHPDLTIGADVAGAKKLSANLSLCFQGMNLVGKGFRVTPEEVSAFGYELNALPAELPPHGNARDLMQGGELGYVIDFFGYTAEDARAQHPALYQRLLDRVKPERDHNNDAQRRRDWWLFGRSNATLRTSWNGLKRVIVTPETSKHRVFAFQQLPYCPDHKLYVVCSADAWVLGVLSSNIHLTWALAAGGTLEDRPTWTNTTCFLPFPFPAASPEQQTRIATLAEQLDTHRKRQQAAHTDLTLTGMYNVLAKLRSGEPLTAKDKTIHETGLVAVLRELHDELDTAVLAAYGWSDLAPTATDALLDRLVALNAERSREEATGHIRWLRPDFQNPAIPNSTVNRKNEPNLKSPSAAQADTTPPKPAEKRPWPPTLPEQVRAIADALTATPQDEPALAARFSGKGPWKKRLPEILAMLAALGRAKQSDGGWVG